MNVQSLAACSDQFEHAGRLWIIEPDLILLQLRVQTITPPLISNIDRSVVVFFCAGDVRHERQSSQVLTRRLRIRNGAELFFPTTLRGAAIGTEAVDCILRECDRRRCTKQHYAEKQKNK